MRADHKELLIIDAAILRLPEGLGTPTNAPKLEVYDAANTLLVVINWDFALNPQPAAGGFSGWQTLSFTSASDNIGHVRFLSGQPGNNPSNFGLFDNLSFSTRGAVPEPGSLALLAIGFFWILHLPPCEAVIKGELI